MFVESPRTCITTCNTTTSTLSTRVEEHGEEHAPVYSALVNDRGSCRVQCARAAIMPSDVARD